VNLFLHRRQVHRDVPAVSEAQWFDDVDDVQLGFEALRECDRAARNALGLFSEVYR
jgi:hypothetical protein